jgi:hypothetical protein
LPGEAERREAIEIVRRIGYADGVVTPESEAVLAKIERILGLDQAPAAAATPAGKAPAGRVRTCRNGIAKVDRPVS